MTTWEEIRDEVAGMLADGQPLEDVLAKLEQRKNEVAKGNLIAVIDEIKKSKPQTNEEYLRSLNTEQLAEHLLNVWMDGAFNVNAEFGLNEAQIEKHKGYILEWLKQPHTKGDSE